MQWILVPIIRPSFLSYYTLFFSHAGEVAKLQQHLDLLREQYVKLQQKHAELEQKYTRAIAVSGNVGTDHFVSQLLKLVSDLFDKPTYRFRVYTVVWSCHAIIGPPQKRSPDSF